MMPWEYRSDRTAIESMGGSGFTVPVQAMVMMLGAPFLSAQDTITTGTGLSIVEGFHCCFGMSRPR